MIEPVLFNRNPFRLGGVLEEPSQYEIECTPNFDGAGVTDAMRFGGEALGRIIAKMPFVGDRRFIIIDTKVSYLMPGWFPAIPGWHTDGVPRGADGDPKGKGAPNLRAQMSGELSAPRYHLIVTGASCPTRFLTEPAEFDVETAMEPGRELYKGLDRQVENYLDGAHTNGVTAEYVTEPGRVITWDWWNVHTATPATETGWRLLVRATETDHVPPKLNAGDFIRKQNQIYVPTTQFGW